MARRQTEIPGTQRTDVPEALLEAGEKWLEDRREARRQVERAKESKLGLIAIQQSHKVKVFKVKDPETQEIITLRVNLEPKLTATKTGEAEAEVIGEGVPSPASGSDVHAGLIAQAEKADKEANVEVTNEGDVVVPDSAAPKKKRRGGKGK